MTLEAVRSLITKQGIKSQSGEISLEDVRDLKGVMPVCLEADESNRDHFIGPVHFCLKIFGLKILWKKRKSARDLCLGLLSIALGHTKCQVKIMNQGRS